MDVTLTLSIIDILAAIVAVISGLFALFKYCVAPPITKLGNSIESLSAHLAGVELDVAKNYVSKRDCQRTHDQIKEVK